MRVILERIDRSIYMLAHLTRLPNLLYNPLILVEWIAILAYDTEPPSMY